ncbi:MAG: glycosyltransferase [Spirochaetes bacterium]|nr:glycosyltransferase [Spirochaetota bacterium]
MRISILTPSYNQGKYIEKTILSVVDQDWPDIEHVVIDGGSTDHTVEILKKYPHLKWISEPDEGQADALNKGLAMATGDIIGWINSDDYYKRHIFKTVVNIFKDTHVSWLIGNTTSTYESFNFITSVKSPEITYKKLLENPDIVRQQAVFFSKTALLKVNGWNKRYYMTMDYDLWLRLSKEYTPMMVDEEWAFFTHHDEQKSTPKNLLIQISNIKEILENQMAPKLTIYIVLLKKYYYYLKSIIKILLIKCGLVDSKYKNISMSKIRDTSNKKI